jgi:hypothetical protein
LILLERNNADLRHLETIKKEAMIPNYTNRCHTRTLSGVKVASLLD